MSLKSIELQVALPRTIDAGKLQEHIQGRGQLINDYASLSVKKEEWKKEKTVTKQERKDITRFRKEKDELPFLGTKKHNEQQILKEKHPYKGAYLDFSG